ncbi:MAG: hypothetical protein ACJ8GN_03755 [Longimicrobiaceae bacterium]
MPPRPAPPAPPLMPVGYLLLGMVLLLVGLGCAATAATIDDVVGRAVFGLVAMLSLLLVEALWWVRPWVGRAVDAWTAGCVGSALIPIFVAATDGAGFGVFAVVSLVVLALVGLPCAVARWYVRDRAARLGLLPGRVP